MKRLLAAVACTAFSLCLFGCTAESPSTEERESEPMTAQEAYEAALNVTMDELVAEEGGDYYYKGVRIPEDEMDAFELIDHLNQNAVYHAIAAVYVDFYDAGEDYYDSWGNEVVPIVFGIEKPATYDEMEEIIEKVPDIISPVYPVGEAMSSFDKLDASEGSFDYKGGAFDFSINDLSAAAAEWGITEEMLGYILAWLDAYGTEVTFEGNSCSVKMDYLADMQMTEKDFTYMENYEHEVSDVPDYGRYSFFVSDLTEAESGEPVDGYGYSTQHTYRGITTGNSKNAVLLCYGEGKVGGFGVDDPFYLTLIESGDDEIAQLFLQATDYLAYSHDYMQLVFYFNGDSELVGVLRVGALIY